MLFTRQRLLANTPRGIGLWAANSGPAPTTPLGTYSLSELATIWEGGRFRRIVLGTGKFWVPADYQPVVRRWSALAAGSE